MDLSAAMTKMMLADAEVMHGLGPVPLLQRQSAVESRWTRTVPTSRESARKSFPKGPFLSLTKMEVAANAAMAATEQSNISVRRVTLRR